MVVWIQCMKLYLMNLGSGVLGVGILLGAFFYLGSHKGEALYLTSLNKGEFQRTLIEMIGQAHTQRHSHISTRLDIIQTHLYITHSYTQRNPSTHIHIHKHVHAHTGIL